MPAAFQAFGAIATGTTTVAPAYPTGVAAGDLLVMVVVNKPETVTPTTPAGWTQAYTGTGGTGTQGGGTGLVRGTVFVREAGSALTGTVTVTVTSGNVAAGSMTLYRKAAGESWVSAAAGGSEATSRTAWSSTMSSVVPFAGGDQYLLAYARSASTTATAQAITATGATFGAATERVDAGSTTNNDISLLTGTGAVTAGLATAAAVTTATNAAATYGLGMVVEVGVTAAAAASPVRRPGKRTF